MLSSRLGGAVEGAASAVIQRPLGAVFDFAGHGFFTNYMRWSPQVVEFAPLERGAVKAGMKARQTTLDRGVRTVSTFEIETFAPPKIIALKGLSQPFTARYEFEKQSDESTLVSFRIEVAERRLFMWPFRQFLRESLDEGARRTVQNLKRAVESDYAAATTSEPLARFIYVTSLDLQEPLRKIEAFSELLENALASSNKADMAYAQEAVRGYAAMARKLVDDLLVYSGAVMGGQHLETLDLREEISGCLRELDGAFAETEADVSFDVPPFRFQADRSQFACLVRNVLTNAIKYRKPGDNPRIRIDARNAEDGSFRLEIADRGVGFKEEFAQAVFQPLRLIPDKAEYPGAGIELAICKSIADRHGWEIGVKSEPGEGTTFYFTIPMLHSETEPSDRETLPAE